MTDWGAAAGREGRNTIADQAKEVYGTRVGIAVLQVRAYVSFGGGWGAGAAGVMKLLLSCALAISCAAVAY